MSHATAGISTGSSSPAVARAVDRAAPRGDMPPGHAARPLANPPAAQRFEARERSHLLLARGVGPGLVALLEETHFSSIDSLRRSGAQAVMAELTQRLGERTRGYSTRALARALASFAADQAPLLPLPVPSPEPGPAPTPAQEPAPAPAPTHAGAAGQAQPVRPLMADIARAAGVAPSTVSRALNDSVQINRQTKARIHELARSASYLPNAIAQCLRARRAHTITVLMPDPLGGEYSMADARTLELIGSLADTLYDEGFQLSLSRPRAGTDRLAQVRCVVDSGLSAGVVALGPWPDAPADLPIVLWGAPDSGQGCLTVQMHAGEGTRLAARLLLDQGARLLAFLGDRHAADLQGQQRGFVQAHQDLGLAQVHGADGDPSAAVDIAALAQAVAAGYRPDGIVAASDWSALAAVQTLRAIGLRVPEDVGVVGFGDTPLAAQAGTALTTVRWPMAQAGQTLANLLLERLAGRRPASVVLTPRLVIRGSTRPC